MYGASCVVGDAPQHTICPVSRSPQTWFEFALNDRKTKSPTPAVSGAIPPLVSPQQLTLPLLSSPQVNLVSAVMVVTGMHTFVPSPKLPGGQAKPHSPSVQVRTAPARLGLGQSWPHSPQ